MGSRHSRGGGFDGSKSVLIWPRTGEPLSLIRPGRLAQGSASRPDLLGVSSGVAAYVLGSDRAASSVPDCEAVSSAFLSGRAPGADTLPDKLLLLLDLGTCCRLAGSGTLDTLRLAALAFVVPSLRSTVFSPSLSLEAFSMAWCLGACLLCSLSMECRGRVPGESWMMAAASLG